MRHKPQARAVVPFRAELKGKLARQLHPPPRALRQSLERQLQVHAVELESQNEDLRRTQIELANARDRLADLYDGAPVGYFTLNQDGCVAEANLTGAALLDIERAQLLKLHFSRFIASTDSDRWHRHLLYTLRRAEPQRIELTMRPRDGLSFEGQLDCLRVAAGGAEPTLRVALTDVSPRKQAELAHRFAVTTVASREAERRRVARELHEDLGQHLSVLKMDLARLRPPTQPADIEAGVAASLTMVDEAIAWVRRIATDLRPLMLDDLGLCAAVDWLTRDTARRTGVSVSLQTDGADAAISPSECVALYRMVQDTLADMTARPGVALVAIEIAQRGGQLELTIQEHLAQATSAGAPVSPAAPTLLGLRQHSYVMGGQLTVDTVDGGGSRVTVKLPLMPDRLQQDTSPAQGAFDDEKKRS